MITFFVRLDRLHQSRIQQSWNVPECFLWYPGPVWVDFGSIGWFGMIPYPQVKISIKDRLWQTITQRTFQGWTPNSSASMTLSLTGTCVFWIIIKRVLLLDRILTVKKERNRLRWSAAVRGFSISGTCYFLSRNASDLRMSFRHSAVFSHKVFGIQIMK